MSRRLLTNLLLLAAVSALGLYLYHSAPEPASPDLITQVHPDSIRHISVVRPGKEDLVFERRGTGWQLADALPVNKDRVQTMLRMLNEVSASRLPVAGLELQRLQLEPPNLTLNLDEHVFVFGDVSPLDKRRFVRYRDAVHLVPDGLFVQLQQGREFFVDHRLLAWEGRLRFIRYTDQHFVADAGVWHAEPAGTWSVDQIEDLVLGWESAHALRVASAGAAPAGEPVVLQNDRGATIRLDVLHAEGETQLARPELGLRYELDADTAQRLLLTGTAPRLAAPAPITN